MRNLLTIAGSDCSGGAGIQADLKTFCAYECYGMSVITAVTVQNTQAVTAIQNIEPSIIAGQLDAVFSDIRVDAVKIGMVSVPEAIEAIASRLRRYRPPFVVVDPVMVSTSGCDLLQPDAVELLQKELLPLATVATPNIPEAQRLTGLPIQSESDMKLAAQVLCGQGPAAVLVKAGHLEGPPTDWLFDGRDWAPFEGRRVVTNNTHGTGCTLSSAIAANLALGHPLVTAIRLSKAYLQGALEHSFPIGQGHGPVHHFYQYYGGTSL